jgi:hypothetical protein
MFGDNWTQYAGFYNGRHKCKLDVFNEQYLAMLKWNKAINMLELNEFQQMWALTEIDKEEDTVEWMHPMILAAKANSPDNPTWNEVMNGP